MKDKVVILGGDDIAVYLNGSKVCECERYEMDVVLRSLGFSVTDDFDTCYESFPEKLEK